MNSLTKSLMALGLAALMTAPASAQQGRRGPGGGMMGGRGGVSAYLSNSGVLEELKLDDAQKTKVAAVAEKAREKLAASRESLQNLEGQERFAKIRELSREIDADVHKELADVLKPEQTARLKGIAYQALGVAVFEEEEVAKALKLTDDQKSSFRELVQASNNEMREVFQDLQGDREAAMSKLRELRKSAIAKAESKLTTEQKAEFAKLLGAPYEVRFEGRGPAGR